VGPEFGHSLAGSFAQLLSRCCIGLETSSGCLSGEGYATKLVQVVGGIHSLAAVSLRGLVCLLRRGPLCSLRLPTFPCHVRFPHVAAHFLLANKRVRQIQTLVFCDVITHICHLCCILQVRNKSEVPPILRERGLYKAMDPPGGEDRGGHLKSVIRTYERQKPCLTFFVYIFLWMYAGTSYFTERASVNLDWLKNPSAQIKLQVHNVFVPCFFKNYYFTDKWWKQGLKPIHFFAFLPGAASVGIRCWVFVQGL